MTAEFVLDTNVYALIFQSVKPPAYNSLQNKVMNEGVLKFVIPEIVAMEIHSVIGKYRRGGASHQEEDCTRQVRDSIGMKLCAQRCVWPARPRMKEKVFRALQKLMADIEGQRGDIQAEVLTFGRDELVEARALLSRFSHLHAFGSHDALVAATVRAGRTRGRNFVLATSDKGLKAVCRLTDVPVFDPNDPASLT